MQTTAYDVGNQGPSYIYVCFVIDRNSMHSNVTKTNRGYKGYSRRGHIQLQRSGDNVV